MLDGRVTTQDVIDGRDAGQKSGGILRFSMHRILLLPAVTAALVGDVAYVVRIETLGSTPLIVDEPGVSLDRPFSLRSRLVESSPGNLLP